MTRHCMRCGGEFGQPIETVANYIRGEDTKEEEPQEVVYGMMHTEETLEELDRLDGELVDRDRQAISAESARPGAPLTIEITDEEQKRIDEEDGSFVETATAKEIDFSIPVDEFNHVEVESPNVVQHDDMIALTYSNVEEREVQKTGLVCLDCVRDDDEVIW